MIPFIKSSSNNRKLLKFETSAIGLRSSCKEELEAIMISYFKSPDDRHLFYSLLKSRYFDYSAILLSICEVIDDKRLFKIVSDLVENRLPEELIADCICVSAGNGPWIGELKYPVNPLISNYFNTKHWSLNQLKHFARIAIQNQSIKTRWKVLLQNNSENLQLFFEPKIGLWKTIQVSDISDSSKALFITKHLVNEIKISEIQGKSEEFLCKMILFSLIKRNFPENKMISKIFERFKTFLLVKDKGNILSKLEEAEYFDVEFIEKVFLKIKSVTTPAIILNFLQLFKDKIESDVEFFNQVIYVFFNSSVLIPTITEICILLQRLNIKRVFNVINLSKTNILFEVFRECPQNLPEKVIRVYIPLQLRIQKVLRKHRKLVKMKEKLVFKLPNFNNFESKKQFNFMLKELNFLFMEIDFKQFDVYNYPVLNIGKKTSFIMAIDRFFITFLNSQDYYILLEDGSIIPDLINLDPKSLESIGYFLGASIILQHPLNFKFNEGYFNLLRSNFIPKFHQILFQVYPQIFRTKFPIAILAKQLEIGINYLYSGLSKALEAQYFSTNELYKLLFPLN